MAGHHHRLRYVTVQLFGWTGNVGYVTVGANVGHVMSLSNQMAGRRRRLRYVHCPAVWLDGNVGLRYVSANVGYVTSAPT